MSQVEIANHTFLVSEKAKRGYLVCHPLRTAELDQPTNNLLLAQDSLKAKGIRLSVVSGFDFYRNPMKLLAGLASATS